MEKEVEKVIDMNQLIFIFRMKWLYILITGFVSLCITFCYFNFLVPEQYSASAQLYIDIRKISSEGKETYINSTHIVTAKELAATYAYIIETNIVLDKVIDDLDLNINQGVLASKISVSIIEDTPVLKIIVIDENKQLAYQIVKKLIEVAPDIINAKIDSGKLISIDKPTVSSSPVSPNVMRNTAIGGVLGLVVSYTVCVLITLSNNKIKTPEDIQRILDIPVLGAIPSLEHITRKK